MRAGGRGAGLVCAAPAALTLLLAACVLVGRHGAAGSVATGDALRHAVASGTEMGLKAKEVRTRALRAAHGRTRRGPRPRRRGHLSLPGPPPPSLALALALARR